MKGSYLKHQKLLDSLEARIVERGIYDHILREWEYYHPRKGRREVDLVAHYRNGVLLFEVKSGSHNGALKQLRISGDYYVNILGYDNARLFLYTPKGIRYKGIIRKR